MKTLPLILLAFAFLLPEAAQSQTYPVDQGSWIVGGSASFTNQGNNNDEDRSTSLFLSPRGQYFVLPGLAIGGTVSLSYTTRDNFSTTGIGAGPAVSYYFGRGVRTVYPFVSASASIRHLSTELGVSVDIPGLDVNADQTNTSYSFDVSGGVAVMIAKNVSLTGEMFYTQTRADNDNQIIETFESDVFGVRFGIAAFVF